MYFVEPYVIRTSCVGNALSTFNKSFSALDTGLYNLSGYAINSVNFLSAYAYTLRTDVNTLSTYTLNSVNYLSANSGGGGGTVAPYDLGNNISGTIELNFDNGSYQRGSLNGDATLSITNGVDGNTITCVWQYNSGNAIYFDSSINMPNDAKTLLPILLLAYYCYKLEFRHMGGYWQLLDISNAFPENLD